MIVNFKNLKRMDREGEIMKKLLVALSLMFSLGCSNLFSGSKFKEGDCFIEKKDGLIGSLYVCKVMEEMEYLHMVKCSSVESGWSYDSYLLHESSHRMVKVNCSILKK